jgi:hypothetical protein
MPVLHTGGTGVALPGCSAESTPYFGNPERLEP